MVRMKRPWLAKDRVRFVGDPVVAILTEERYQGPDAAELAFIDYDPLTAVVTVDDSKKDETLLYPDPIPTNSGTADLAGCSTLQPQ